MLKYSQSLKSDWVFFWLGMCIYAVFLSAAVWIDRRESMHGKIVMNFWVIVTIVAFNTLATALQYKAILTIRRQIITKIAMKESSNHIAMNLTIFGLVNFFLLANLSVISYTRRNESSEITIMLVGWSDVFVSLTSTALQVFIAFLIVRFSQPILTRIDPVLNRSVNLRIYLKAGSELAPFKSKMHSRHSEAEIEQAFKSY